MKVLIIEDEELAVKKLRKTLNAVDESAEVVGVADSIRSSVNWLQNNPSPDLILMDIELCDGQSFEIFDKVEVKSTVIFTTSYDEFALKAFEVNALDYLLKPVEPKRLADAIHKLQHAENRETRTTEEYINNSILSEHDQVFVKDGERCWFVKLSEIRLFESVGNYAKVFFGPNKPLILKSLNALEERLDEKFFFRANRKHIVNLRMIDKIEPYFNGGLLLELKGGEKIEVSRRQTVKFKEMMSL